ncbi:hypothetical protein LTR66_010050 [Elasticomyces elasticus]|nr:hypothetical protein LTR66_010050 [Elasticomyces elasticus]KAK5009314.1 hypothetical protein LTR28_001645 [Elasticomyces elasticus]
MSEDWESVTKIGSKTRGGAGASERERVLKGSALTAAQRSGAAISSEKKFGGTNAASANTAGQRLTKVANSDDIVKPPSDDKELAQNIQTYRKQQKGAKGETMTQKELATKANLPLAEVSRMESTGKTTDPKIQEDYVRKLEKALNVHLRGALVGQPKIGKKKV